MNIMPGDYSSWHTMNPSDFTTTELNDYSIELREVIRLIEPHDNSVIDMNFEDIPTYGTSVDFKWEPLGRATDYELYVYKVNNSAGTFESIISESGYRGSSYTADLAPTGIDEHYEFYIYASDAAGTQIGQYAISYLDGNSRNLNFKVDDGSAATYIVLDYPVGGEHWTAGDSEDISWYSEGVSTVTIEYSVNNGIRWNLLAANVDTTPEYYTITVPQVSSEECLIRIISDDNTTIRDRSDDVFTIEPGQATSDIIPKFIFPTGDAIQFSSPAIADDGTIYIGSLDQQLYAINPDGSQKWAFHAGPMQSSPAVAKDGTIYIGSLSGGLYAINPDGSEKWKFFTNADNGIVSTPAIGKDGTIYFGTVGGKFIALRDDNTRAEKIWEYGDVGAQIMSSPAITVVGGIFFGADNGYMYKLSSAGTLLKKTPTGAEAVFSSPAIGEDGTIYIGTNGDGFLKAFFPNLTLKWSTWMGTMVESSPVIGPNGKIYVGARDSDGVYDYGYLYAVDPNDGHIEWVYDSGGAIVSTPAIGSDGIIYFGDDNGTFHAVSQDNPDSPLWTYDTDDTIWSSPAIGDDGIIYFGSFDGHLYAIDSKTSFGYAYSSWPKFHRNSLNTGTVVSEEQEVIIVLSPDGRENWTPGNNYEITWTSENVTLVDIEYSLDNGQNWTLIETGVSAGAGSYTWSINQGIDSAQSLVRVVDTDSSIIFDRSNDTFTISQSAFIEVLNPNGGEKFTSGDTEMITWLTGGVTSMDISLSTDSGSTWTTIASGVNAGEGYSWTVPSTLTTTGKIKVTDSSNASVSDESNSDFSIISSDFISLTSPSFGDRWTVGSTKEITWTFNGLTNVKIELSLDDGSTWTDIVASVSAGSGTYSWIVPDSESSQSKIKISDTTSAAVTDTGNRFEIIKPELSITHTPVTIALENEEIDFAAVVTSTSEISTVTLYYDVTGNRLFSNSITLTSNDSENFSGTLTSGIFTAEGMEYYLQAKDANGKITESPADEGYYSIMASVSDMKSPEVVRSNSEQTGYRMISIPLNLTETSITKQLEGRLPSGDTGTDWRLYRFPSGDTTPGEYPDIEGFAPGIAFWLISGTDFELQTPEGTTVSTDESFSMTLKSGWNDIANPWMFDISWDDIENPSSAELSALYTYTGAWSNPTAPIDMKPWTGYAVKNLENRNVIIKLQPKSATESAKIALASKESAQQMEQPLWQLNITASAGQAVDTANYIGVRNSASSEWDRSDHVEPPAVGKYVSISFPHNEWARYPSEYTVDFRPPGESITWDFTVKTNIVRELVDVEIIGTENLPDEYDIRVIDQVNGKKVTLLNNTFRFVSESDVTERQFTIIVSSALEPEEQTDAPEEFITVRSYPNPFNPQTTIAYELSQPGRVTVTVFNSVGQKVYDYDGGYRDMGSHELVFDASHLTTGIYFYLINAGYNTATGKMLYMK